MLDSLHSPVRDNPQMIRQLLFVFLLAQVAFSQTVRFRTTQGDIDVTLLSSEAPQTVANFLRYVNRGDYSQSFFHRSVRNFIIQGGGYRWVNNTAAPVREDPPVQNEFRVSNTRGTIAMAKLGTNPNSATNQWFFNLTDNSQNLNNQNGGFTVFGRVANAAGLAVMDRIANVPVYNAGSPFDSIPLANYTGGPVAERNLVIVTSIIVLDQPAISEGGIVTASNFGGFAAAAPGSFIEIYGSNLSAGPGRTWAAGDFNGVNAPTSLEGVTVTIGGLAAFVYYVSPNQVNVQVPDGVPPGSAPVVLSRNGISSPAGTLVIQDRLPGLLAPASFRSGDTQFLVAVRPDGTFVSDGSIEGLPNAPARAGEILNFYGTGFGAVTPGEARIAGEIAQGQSALVTPVEFRIGDRPAELTYAGLAPGLVGVYQFNVRVPEGLERGAAPVSVRQGGEPLGQTLFLPVTN